MKADAAAGQLKEQGRRAGRSRSVGLLARAGLASQAAAFALVAVLALKLALHEGGKAADPASALGTLVDDPLGKPVLILLVFGFLGYAVWRFAQAFLDRGDEGSDSGGLARRAAHVGRGLVYAGLAVATARLVLGGGSGGDSEEKQVAAGVLGWPGGRVLVAAAGIGIACIGLANGYAALSKRFMDELELRRLHRPLRLWVERIAQAGLLARMVVFGIVGWFLVKAALEHDPKDAVGIGGALAKVAAASYGSYLLGIVAAGLLAFAAFCAVSARYAKV